MKVRHPSPKSLAPKRSAKSDPAALLAQLAALLASSDLAPASSRFDVLVTLVEGAKIAGMPYEAFRKRVSRGAGIERIFDADGKTRVRKSDCQRLRSGRALLRSA